MGFRLISYRIESIIITNMKKIYKKELISYRIESNTT